MDESIQSNTQNTMQEIGESIPRITKPSRRFLYIAFGGCIATLAILGVFWFRSSFFNVSSRFCFVRLNYLVCEDENGKRVRYDLPKVENENITSLSTSPDQTQFLATTYTNKVYLLNNKLQIIKKLNLNVLPSWSHNGKFLFYPRVAGASVGIYKYSLETDKSKQLTEGINNVMDPFETKDGYIIYSSHNKQYPFELQAYIRNTDGSGARSLQSEIINTIDKNLKNILLYASLSYDQSSDAIFALIQTGEYEINKNFNYFIVSANIDSLLNGGKIQVVPTDKISSDADVVTRLNDSTIILWSDLDNKAYMIDLNSKKILKTIDKIGVPLNTNPNTSVLKLSSNQQEQPYDRIMGLEKVPADFQTFIKSEFDKVNSECLIVHVGQIVRDRFASTAMSCPPNGGVGTYYVKTNGNWTEVFKLQNFPTCDLLDKYKFTKEILSKCTMEKNNISVEVENTNP